MARHGPDGGSGDGHCCLRGEPTEVHPLTRTLLTGARGLLGRRVQQAWGDHGQGELVPVGRELSGRSLDLSRLEDTRALLAEVRPDVVLHLVGGPSSDLDQVWSRNVLSGLALLQAVTAEASRPAVFLVGSAAEYGEGAGLLCEDAPLAPLTEYGRAKAAQTRAAQALARQHDVLLTILRPFNLVAWDLPASAPLGNVRTQLLQQTGPMRSVVCGRTSLRRDFVAATDTAAVIAQLAARPPGGVLNICSGRGAVLADIIHALGDRLGVEVDVEEDPALMALPAADHVVGDPSRLRELGHVLDGSPGRVAAALLNDERADGSGGR